MHQARRVDDTHTITPCIGCSCESRKRNIQVVRADEALRV